MERSRSERWMAQTSRSAKRSGRITSSFRLTASDVEKRRQEGYNPRTIYESNANLREVIDSLTSGEFSRGDRHLFQPLVNSC